MHKWIEHHCNGPIVVYKCLVCKHFAFHFVKINNNNELPSYPEEATVQRKIEITAEWFKGSSNSGSYLNEKDLNELKDSARYNCEELEVRDILL